MRSSTSIICTSAFEYLENRKILAAGKIDSLTGYLSSSPSSSTSSSSSSPGASMDYWLPQPQLLGAQNSLDEQELDALVMSVHPRKPGLQWCAREEM